MVVSAEEGVSGDTVEAHTCFRPAVVSHEVKNRHRYQVQRTATLSSPQWQNLGAPLSGQTFSSLMEGDAAFFRVVVLTQ
jgi:hypothetical protein